MKPVYQTNTTKGEGNCFSACLASLLEIPCDDVPNFFQQGVDYHTAVNHWLRAHGFNLLQLHGDAMDCFLFPWMVGCYAIASVPSQRFENTNHAVVIKWTKNEGYQWEIVHDPKQGNEPYANDIEFKAIYILIKGMQ